MIDIDRIHTVERLLPLEKEWDSLLLRCPHQEPYLAHDWIVRWCRSFAGSGELQILLIKEGERLIGIAPLILTRKRVRGVSIRQLGFLLNGCSVRSNLIVPPEDAKKAVSALVRYFKASAPGWDLVRLHGISEQSGILPALQEALDEKKGLRSLLPISWENAVIPLEGSWESYLKSRSRHFRKRLGVTERNLETQGKVTFTCHRDPHEVESTMEKIFDIEARSWKVERGEAMVARPDYREFYQATAKAYAEKGAWRAWILEVEGKPVASHFGFLYAGTFYSEKQSYDAGYHAISPGKAVFRFFVESSFTERFAREIDLDNKTSFSEHWADGARRYHEIQIFNRRLFSTVLFGMKRQGYPLLMKTSAFLRRKNS